jgi:hypothetical protein
VVHAATPLLAVLVELGVGSHATEFVCSAASLRGNMPAQCREP